MPKEEKFHKEVVAGNDELPFSPFPITNSNATGIFALVMLAFAFISPYLPSKHRPWHPPATSDEYFSRVETTLLIYAALFALTLLWYISSLIRTRIDRAFGYKFVGVFDVKNVSERKSKKIVSLTSGESVTLSSSFPAFDNIQPGQSVEVTRSATWKLVSCKIVKQ